MTDNDPRAAAVAAFKPFNDKLAAGQQLSPSERLEMHKHLANIDEIDAARNTLGSVGLPASQAVVVNADNQLVANNISPAAGATIVAESPFIRSLYADKRCAVRRCKEMPMWRIMTARLKDNGDVDGLPRGIPVMGPPVLDSLQAEIEFAAHSIRNRPMGTLVEDEGTYYCEAHLREQEKKLLADAEAAAAETVKRKAAANPYLWSLDPTDVKVEFGDDGNFVLNFPDGFSMSWESFRVEELTRWRKQGHRVSA